METINICYATDNEYIAICGVSLHSVIKSNPAVNYKIYILYHKDKLYPFKIKKFLKAFENYKNVLIYFIDVSSYWEDFNKKCQARQIEYISETACYRLCLDVFIDDDKVLYLDCDTIVVDDILKLWNIDISSYLFGAVKDKADMHLKVYFEDFLHINPLEYFNSGILLINLNKYKKENISKKCLEKQKEVIIPLFYQDQDMLNMVGYGKVKFLDFRWNKQWTDIVYPNNFSINKEFNYVDWSDIGIIHYNTDWKPWNCPEMYMSHLFWDCARETSFYEEILIQSIKNNIARKRE